MIYNIKKLLNKNFTKRIIEMNHIELAKKYFEQKYHCSQAVLAQEH